jgi:(R,R)-butanediol dehydrogenase/meso-butanediol dehydrogenase/diacetyl reductase
MKCAVFHGPGDLRIDDRPRPALRRDDDVLMRVEAASICGTDLHILADPPGHPATPGTILGHEYVCEVVDAGDRVDNVRPGDRVVVDPSLVCGRCPYCRRGRPNLCLYRDSIGIFRDGGFAEFSLTPAAALYSISKETPLDHAVFAEPLSCVLNGFTRAGLAMGDSVLVLGGGPVGLLFLMLFRSGGAGRVGLTEITPGRRRLAEISGADHAWDPRTPDLAAQVREWSGGLGADIVVDCVGTLLGQALQFVRRGGRVLLFGMNQQAAPAVSQYEITRHEITITGSCISPFTFPPTVRLLEGGRLPLDPLITHRIGLDGLHGVIPSLHSGEAVEVVITPG